MSGKRLETPWNGWSWYEDVYLVDENGTRYSPDMIKSSVFTLELWAMIRNQGKFGYCSSVPALTIPANSEIKDHLSSGSENGLLKREKNNKIYTSPKNVKNKEVS